MTRVRFARGLQAGTQRIDEHHHARASAERAVVDAAVVAFGVVAGIPAMQRQQPAFLRPPDHAEAGALGDEFREQADDVDAHGVRSPRPSRP